MAKKKKQTIGYKYFASGHFVLCHGPIDAITKISFQDKDAYLNEENANKTIYINKPSLFGGDEQSGGVQGNIELLFGRADQQKSTVLQRICAKISNAFGGLISAYRGVCSVVFDNVYIGTAPNMPDSKWRVKRIHTRHDGQIQWYDEKAEISAYQIAGDNWEYVQLPYHANPGYENLTPPTSGWKKSSRLPFNDSNGWSRNPDLSILWVKKKITLKGGEGVVLQVGADNGCLLWVDGNFIGASNRDNLDIDSNQKYPVEFGVPQTGTFEILIKAFTESTSSKQAGNYLNIVIDGVKAGDINPAHIIRECLTNQVWGIGVSESNIDDISFKKSSDILFNENMGMSIKWTDSTSINEFVDNIKEHINAQLYLDRVTNKWKLYLIRDDYDVVDLISLDESNIRNLDFERRTLAECVNSVTVTYWDRERAKDSTVTVQDIARIAQQGGVISQSIDYKGFTNSDLASRVALRDLKTLSSTLATVSFDVDESFSESWHEGMPFKLSDESYGLSEAVMRIRTIKRGDGINNAVYVEAIEDSFSSPMQSVVEYVPPINSGDSTAKNATAIVFEVPYIELVEQYGQDEVDAKLLNYPDIGYVGMAAIRPNNQHINASLYVDSGAGYDERTTLDFCPSAELKAEIGYMDSSFEIQNVAEFELLEVNHRIQMNDEIMAFVSFDTATNMLTVKRGCFDTVPQKHDAGSKVFGWDNYSGIDDLEYLSGESVSLKAITLTGSDVLELNEATSHNLILSSRAIRPYPPANVKVNEEYWPEEITGDAIVTWTDRNRVQQTGGIPLSWFDQSVAVEDGVTYHYETVSASDVVLSHGDLVSSGLVLNVAEFYPMARLKLWSKRDGHVCMNPIEIFLVSAIGELINFVEPIYANGERVDLIAKLNNSNQIISVTFVDGQLPNGWVLNGNSIKGKASVDGEYSFTLEVEDELANILQKTFTVKIQGKVWSQLMFESQNMLDEVAGNSWILGTGNTFVPGFESNYALKLGGNSVPTISKNLTLYDNIVTMSAWIKLTSYGQYEGVIYAGNIGANTNRDNLYIYPDGELRVYRQAGTNTGTTIYTGYYVPLNTWIHVAYERDRINQRVFVNHELIAVDINTASVATTSQVYIGGNRSGGIAIYSKLEVDNVLITIDANRFS